MDQCELALRRRCELMTSTEPPATRLPPAMTQRATSVPVRGRAAALTASTVGDALALTPLTVGLLVALVGSTVAGVVVVVVDGVVVVVVDGVVVVVVDGVVVVDVGGVVVGEVGGYDGVLVLVDVGYPEYWPLPETANAVLAAAPDRSSAPKTAALVRRTVTAMT